MRIAAHIAALVLVLGAASAALGQEPRILEDGVPTEGFFIGSEEEPFAYPHVRKGSSQVTLQTLPEEQRQREPIKERTAAILLYVRDFDPGQPLEAQIVGTGSGRTLEDAREVTFAGVTGLRIEGATDAGIGPGKVVFFGAVVDGRLVQLTAEGAAEKMTDEVIAVIDAVAATVRPQTESDLAKAAGE